MSLLARTAKRKLSDITHFSNLVIKVPLRPYQLTPLQPVIDSILHQRGTEFLVIYPRQAGKNEAIAQLLVYLLNLFHRVGGNIVYGATADGLGMGIQRLEDRLDNVWNWGHWTAKTRPRRRVLGKAAVLFLSTYPQAATRGQTAHWLLVIDETQDQDAAHIEAVFTPMRAANNATAVYIGTVRLTSDFLWQKKTELERETVSDGIQRVFMVGPDEVCQEVPAYRQFLDRQVRKHGRHHPIVASEYFLEPIDGGGGLFDERRRLLMRGSHPRLAAPLSGELYVATLDVAGEDEAATDPVAQLNRPGRDYTVATVYRVRFPPPGVYAPGPTYEAVDVFVDHGSKHFQDHPGQPALVHRLHAWLASWGIAHLVSDETGVGLGLTSWLAAALGERRLTGFTFSRNSKARLGSLFLSLVETGRFKYWTGDEDTPLSDGWWFWRQVEACSYDLPPGGGFDTHLRWEVPASHKTPAPGGKGTALPTHDDRLISAALVAELDRLYRDGSLILGTAESAVIVARNPLEGLKF
jgi:hypothetical protein